MGRSKDLATGETRFVNTSGDSMTGELLVRRARSNTAGDAALTIHPSDTTVSYGMRIDQNTNSLNFDKVNSGTTLMSIDGSGRVTNPNQPCFAAYRDAGDVETGNVYVFDHTVYNDGNMYNSSNGRGTVPVSGKYLVAVWLMTHNTTYNNKYYRIRVNGSEYKRVYSANGGAYHHQQSWTGVINLNANDYVEVVSHNVKLYGSSVYYSNFNMHLLS